MSHVKIAVIGAGSRGKDCYGKRILDLADKARVTAVADPDTFKRQQMAQQHNIPESATFTTWQEMLAQPKLADAVIVATSDRDHHEPAIAAAQKGYHILLEKPMAATIDHCKAIVAAAKQNNVMLAVCHVLRHAPFYQKVHEIINTNTLGDICSIQWLEGIAWWHYAHSYVRGIFANEQKASFILLAKCCHDIDLIRWLVDKPCLCVSSFGALKHFTAANQPQNAADRCLDCPLSNNGCPYSAETFYLNRLKNDMLGWPLSVITNTFTEDAVKTALRQGPYGRCVYRCDNNVMDTQIVNMQFQEGITASLTMSAFTPHGRQIRIMGTKGYLQGDSHAIKTLDFNTEQWSETLVSSLATDITGGHGGGDQRLLADFINAVQTNNPHAIKTGPDVTLDSHLITFAADIARKENRLVSMQEIYDQQ